MFKMEHLVVPPVTWQTFVWPIVGRWSLVVGSGKTLSTKCRILHASIQKAEFIEIEFGFGDSTTDFDKQFNSTLFLLLLSNILGGD